MSNVFVAQYNMANKVFGTDNLFEVYPLYNYNKSANTEETKNVVINPLLLPYIQSYKTVNSSIYASTTKSAKEPFWGLKGSFITDSQPPHRNIFSYANGYSIYGSANSSSVEDREPVYYTNDYHYIETLKNFGDKIVFFKTLTLSIEYNDGKIVEYNRNYPIKYTHEYSIELLEDIRRVPNLEAIQIFM